MPSKNKLRNKLLKQEWNRNNPDKIKAWVKNNPTKVWEMMMRCVYGPAGPEHFHKQLIEQSGLCAICARELNPATQDHDHACCPPVRYNPEGKQRNKCCGKCSRGLLCRICNQLLGHFEQLLRDNPILIIQKPWIQLANNYLQTWKTKIAV